MIRLRSINRIFEVGEQTVHALDDVSLTINAGEYLSIMGPSGSGKSTLLNMLGLLDRPDSGQYKLDDIETSALNDDALAAIRRNKIGFIFQAFHLIARLSAAENVELPLMLAGQQSKLRRHRVLETLSALDLSDRANHQPAQLSGGQRQRVAIARAIAMRPQVLLADEPTGNLDRQSGNDVIDVLEALNRDGLTLLVVTHDP
ncbi:MAG: ABC transporter ATP-binding protein, partial [Gammaproteobacteria bacterium]|nr:ABC transporter ATP-binding protein [Gammaproteobacteria bacterium]